MNKQWQLLAVVVLCFASFRASFAQPSITSLSPTSGMVGASVTIAGTNFGSTQGASTVTFNGAAATSITGWGSTSITATVPTGATTGNVVVTVGGVASNGVWFTLNDTYGNGYQYRQMIVLSHSNVPNTDQTNFPVLISGAYTFLANASDGGFVQNPNGYDIVFSQDPEGATQLDYETDSYTAATGTAAFWVRIPTLSHTVDTVIYLFYGNPNITTSQQNVAGVWSNNYLSVYHLGNGTSVGLSDSSSAGYTLEGSASAVTGKIGGGAAFYGNSYGGYLYNDSLPAYPSGDSPVTLETWVQLGGSGDAGEILGYGANTVNGSRDAMYWDGANLLMEMENMGVSGPFPYDSNWHHLVSVYGGGVLSSTSVQLYLDGAPLSTGTSGGTPAITTTEFKIGGMPTVNFCCAFTGSVDEVRVSSGVRSADWVATEYANQSSPSTFYTVEGPATPNSAPTIEFLSPATAAIGALVTIQGYGFQPAQGTSTVTFNGVTATAMSWNDASIVVPVPAGVTTGNVVVTVSGVASNGVNFTVLPTPSITSLSATSGAMGVPVTITGTNFGSTQGTSTVTFNGTTATTISSWSTTSITATVPTGATTGAVVVTVSGVVSNGSSFTVAPSITSLSPTSGTVGAAVTITGLNFGSTQSASTVTFNGTAATSITGWSTTSITATVPTGATTGEVVVTVGGIASNGVAWGVCDGVCTNYSSGYQYRQAIVLSHAKVPNTDQTNFPVLISGVYPFLANVSSGGLVQNPNGYDIIFSQDPEGATQLAYETDGYDPATGTAAFWVQVPTLSHTVDTVIYVFYGNSSITTSQQNVAGVWSNNYLSVYHLGNGTSVGLADSGSAGYTLEGSATAVPGKIGGGVAFNGNAGTYLYNDSLPAYPSGDSPLTLETWFQLATSVGGFDIVGYGANSAAGSRAAFAWDGSNIMVEFLYPNFNGPMPYDTNWHHLVGVYGGGTLSTTTDQLYLDGAPLSITIAAGTPAIENTEFKIGGIPTVNFCCAFTGSVDEVRVSSGVRSSDWVATEYANESSPSTFYTVEGQATAYSAATIEFLSPAASPLGTVITIQGYGFQPAQGTSTVTFNGVTATPTSWNDASIVVPVPAGATTGNVVVTVGGVASNGVNFTVLPVPSITSLNPTSGAVGTSVTITGTNFGSTQGTSTVTFNGAAATTITSWGTTSIVVTVPTGATTGNVVVTVSGVPSPGVNFTVYPIPAVSSLSPTAGPAGTQVTIQGSNFGSSQGASTVSFNGASAASIVSWSNTQIVAVAPTTVTTGPVTVTANSIPSNATIVFTAYNPIIVSVAPPSGAVGGTITINGSGFGVTQNGVVSINGVAAIVTTTCLQNPWYACWSDTQIQVIVNDGTTSGPLTVSNAGVVSSPVTFTVEAPPAITSLSPTTGEPTTVITIGGSGFGANQSDSTVAVGGLNAPVTSWSDTQIVASVPAIPMNGSVTVTVAGITAQGPIFYYDAINQLTASNGAVTTYDSGDFGNAWRVYSSSGPGCSTCSVRGNVANTYDNNGNLLTTTDANGNTITYTYDGNNNMTSQTAQLNGSPVTTSYTYNSFAEVLTMTDALGNTTTNTYDGNGNLLSVTSPAPNSQTPASVTQFSYNTLGELTQILDPLNHATTIAYYSTGLIQSITDAQNNTTSYAYDSRGNRTSVIDPINGSAHPTTFTYDPMSRLTGITYPNGTSAGFAYDSRGRRISATDQNGKTTTYAYDDADRLISVTDPASNLTQYGYDTEGNLTSITDGNNHTTYFTYDTMGRVIQTTFPSTLTETYSYDQLYNLTSKTDRKGQTIQYVYDSLYRMTSKTYPDETSASYVYDLVGKIQQVTDPTGTYAFAYDNMGRLIGTSTQYVFLPGYNFQNSYSYDAASNRKSLTAPDGSTNSYNYDTLNRLTTLTNSLTGQFGFAYDALSRRTQLTRPNGINTNYSYDSVSHLLSVLHQAGSTTLDGASYSYDYAGNRTSKTNYLDGTTWNYGYDAIYELLQVTHGGSTTESFSYDAVGNRLSSSGVPSYSYNSSNELTSNSNGSYTYDANGNTLSDAAGRSYTWDFENRLTQVVNPGVGTTTFRYDPFGRRIQKSGPLGTTNYLYDGLDSSANLIEELDSAGNVLARYAQELSVDAPLSMLRSGTGSYYQADGLGSITSLSSSAGALANTYTYDSFGKLTASTGTLTNPFQYTAREADSETGTYYYRARYFDQNVGRFVSEDPIGFRGGINFYRYVSNNPLNLTDPTGLVSGDRASCSYYDKHCKYGCNGSSNYECRAGACCRSFPEDPKANCTRECLISWEIADCSNMSGSQQAACRRLAHLVCYRKCKFFPNPMTLPAVCWSIADGY
jgi:RHS repeat-associated protein